MSDRMQPDIDDIIAFLTSLRENEARDDWLRRTEKLCEEWGPIVLLWTQDEVYKQAENARRLAEAIEGLLRFPVIAGQTAHIRDMAKQAGVENPLDIAATALELHEKVVFTKREKGDNAA